MKLPCSLSFFNRWELSCSHDADRRRGVPSVIAGPHLHTALVLRKGLGGLLNLFLFTINNYSFLSHEVFASFGNLLGNVSES